MKNNILKFRPLGLLVALFLITSSIQAQTKLENLCKKLSENDKMTNVFISKDMMSNMIGMANPNSDTTDVNGMKSLAKSVGYMRVLSSKDLTPDEQAKFNKMILEVLNDGYNDLMNVSAKEKGKITNVKMCVKQSDKDNISEFVIYVSEGQELSLIAIVGNIKNSDMMKLSQLSNLKGMVNETMKQSFGH